MRIQKLICTGILSAALIAITSSAFADDKWLGEEGSNWLQHVIASKSVTTREAVKDETAALARRGEVTNGDEPTYPKTTTASTQTRAEVRADAMKSTRLGRSNHSVYTGG